LNVKRRFTEEHIIGFLRQAPKGAGAENTHLERLLAESMLANKVTKVT
jgi:hypothetical protein